MTASLRSRAIKWSCGLILSLGAKLPALAANDAPFAETVPFLTLLLQNDAAGLAKGLHFEALGNLYIPDGHIIALDPLLMMGAEQGFAQTVAPGHYPVSVYWVEDKVWGKRNAFAKIKFSDGEVKSWHMAVNDGQDINKLKHGEFYGYGVGAGMGAFLSPEAFAAMNASMDKAQKEIPNYSNYYDDVLAKDLEITDPSRLLYAPPTDPEKNVAMFASGFGDGTYPSYFGLDATGRPVALVTTFLVVDQAAIPKDPKHPPAKK